MRLRDGLQVAGARSVGWVLLGVLLAWSAMVATHGPGARPATPPPEPEASLAASPIEPAEAATRTEPEALRSPLQYLQIAPAPDGRTIAFSVHAPYGPLVCFHDVATGSNRFVAQGDMGWTPERCWSPDSRWFAFRGNAGTLVASRDSTEVRALGAVGTPDGWSTTGRFLALELCQDAYQRLALRPPPAVYDMRTGEVRRVPLWMTGALVGPGDLLLRPAPPSPNAQLAEDATIRSLMLLDLATGEERRIGDAPCTVEGGSPYAYAVRPVAHSGGSYAWSGNELGPIVRVHVPTGAMAPVEQDIAATSHSLSPSPDGRWLAISYVHFELASDRYDRPATGDRMAGHVMVWENVAPDRAPVLRHDIAFTPGPPVLEGQSPEKFWLHRTDWSPDGSSVLTAGKGCRMLIDPISGRAEEPWPGASAEDLEDLQWLTDDSFVGVAGEDGGPRSAYVIVRGTGSRQAAIEPRDFAFETRPWEGSARRRIPLAPAGDPYGKNACPSPDGRRVAFSMEVDGRLGTYIADALTGETRCVLPGEHGASAWAPGSDRLAISDGQSLSVWSLVDGGLRDGVCRVSSDSKPFWSESGRYVACETRDDGIRCRVVDTRTWQVTEAPLSPARGLYRWSGDTLLCLWSGEERGRTWRLSEFVPPTMAARRLAEGQDRVWPGDDGLISDFPQAFRHSFQASATRAFVVRLGEWSALRDSVVVVDSEGRREALPTQAFGCKPWIALSPDGQTLAVLYKGYAGAVEPIASARDAWRLVAFDIASPDRMAQTVSCSVPVEPWGRDHADEDTPWTLEWSPGSVRLLLEQIAPDGYRVAAPPGVANRLAVDMRTGEILETWRPRGSTGPPRVLTWLTDDSFVALFPPGFGEGLGLIGEPSSYGSRLVDASVGEAPDSGSPPAAVPPPGE